MVAEFARSVRYGKKLVVYWIEKPEFATISDNDVYEKLRAANTPVVVQSPYLRAYLEVYLQFLSGNIYEVPPVVDRSLFAACEKPAPSADQTIISYSGKIDAEYGLELLLDLIDTRATSNPKLSFEICQGKLTRARDMPELFRRYQQTTQNAHDGLVVRENLPQSGVAEMIATAHYGYCLRTGEYDFTTEVSTKLVEYCSVGTPPIANRTRVNMDLLGEDYPLLLDTNDLSVERVTDLISTISGADYEELRARCLKIADRFSFTTAQKEYAKLLNVERDARLARLVPAETKLRVLIAGHDFKFIERISRPLEKSRFFDVSYDRWAGIGNSGHSQKDHKWDGDVIFCEWCCANAVWYSNNLQPHQRLVIRLHRFEMFTEFPKQVNWDNVDKLIVVSDSFKFFVTHQTRCPAEKIEVFPQFIEARHLDRPKLPQAAYTIGMVGINPFFHKRFDRAIDFFEKLCLKDERFRLRVRSVMPWNIAWLWEGEKRRSERTHYEELFARIMQNRMLKDRIIFDEPGSDMEEWYREIGYILSSSDSEGCHTSVLEGMASGCRPIVFAWPGADTLFPEEHVYGDLDDAIALLLADRDGQVEDDEKAKLKKFVANYDTEKFMEFATRQLLGVQKNGG